MSERSSQGDGPRGSSEHASTSEADAALQWIDQRVEVVRRLLKAPPAPAPLTPDFLRTLPTTARALAPYLDHTLLKPEATLDQVLQICVEAKTHGFAGVCVNPWVIPHVYDALKTTTVRPVAVVGFPLGASFSEMKAAEAAWSVQWGAREVDVVLNIGALKSGFLVQALDDLKGMVEACAGYPVKVIIETHLLTDSEKVDACVMAELAEASFVKTCTGFSGGGAAVADVKLMRRAVGDRLSIKASGGIRDTASALALVAAGARRLGTSASVALIRENQGASGC